MYDFKVGGMWKFAMDATTSIIEILVFKTNVTSKKKVSMVAQLLTSFPSIRNWNFDLQDRDKVLRIEAAGISPDLVETLLITAGFHCEELD